MSKFRYVRTDTQKRRAYYTRTEGPKTSWYCIQKTDDEYGIAFYACSSDGELAYPHSLPDPYEFDELVLPNSVRGKNT